MSADIQFLFILFEPATYQDVFYSTFVYKKYTFV